MPSYGATKTMPAEPKQSKMPKKELAHVEMREAENGGVTAEHHFTSYEHKPEVHVFGSGDGHALAAHIEKHLGIKMPGKSATESMEQKEGDEG